MIFVKEKKKSLANRSREDQRSAILVMRERKKDTKKKPALATVMPKGSTKRKRNKKAEGKTRRENEKCS
jgi:hypothetical protein